MAETVVTREEMDPIFRDEWDRILERARGASNQGYTPYGGQRIAGPNDLQNASWQGIASLGMAGLPQGFLQGEAGAANTLAAMSGMGERGYGDLSGVAGRFGAAGQRGYGDLSGVAGSYDPVFNNAGNVEKWIDEGLAEKYMNPYQRLVNDIQVRNLELAGARQQAQLGGMAANMGAFGGARHGLMQENMASNTRQQISDAVATGQRDAYNMGIGAFNADRAAEQRGLDQQLGALAGKTNALGQANQFALQGLQGESSSLGMANQLLQSGLNSEMRGAHTLAQISGMGQSMNLELLNAMNNAGQQQRGIEQQFLNQGYQDFLNQRDWNKSNIEWMTNILQGLPQIGLTTQHQNQQQTPWQNAVGGAGMTGQEVYTQMNNNVV